MPAADDAYARYSQLMSQSQALIADDILDAFQPSTHRSWLDLGGGEGVFIGGSRRIRAADST